MAKNLKIEEIRLGQLDGAKEFALLRAEAKTKGYLEPNPMFYWTVIAILTFLTGLSAFALVRASIWWQTVLCSMAFAFLAIQWGGIMHDAGHGGIYASNKINDIFGFAASVLLGTSYIEWKSKHNNHHAHTNEVEEDTDLMIPVLSYTLERARSRTGWQKPLVKYQAWLFHLFACAGVIAIRLDNLINFWQKRSWDKKIIMDRVLFLAGMLLWYVVPFMFFSWQKALLFVITLTIFTGQYIVHVFAPNHKGMVEIPKGIKLSFLEQQIITARNVLAHPVWDHIYIGLNYQIEHHLFPSCPRSSLSKLAPMVKKYCLSRKFPYDVIMPWQTDVVILKELSAVAKLVN